MPPLAASVPECQESLSILLVRCGCARSRHLVRCLLAAKGAAWLRPWLFCRILRASKHSSKAAARGGTSSLPAAFRKCYETSSIWFGLSTMNKINHMIEQILVQRTNHIGLVWQHLRRTAGREDGYTLAAALEECLELLGILQNN